MSGILVLKEGVEQAVRGDAGAAAASALTHPGVTGTHRAGRRKEEGGGGGGEAKEEGREEEKRRKTQLCQKEAGGRDEERWTRKEESRRRLGWCSHVRHTFAAERHRHSTVSRCSLHLYLCPSFPPSAPLLACIPPALSSPSDRLGCHGNRSSVMVRLVLSHDWRGDTRAAPMRREEKVQRGMNLLSGCINS
ncbi:unnamed protein product [Pleuronectes platessa]|uniref:Uncharacterized protein n=1 Tax=Pleuronectes platessa TaxID=8262 RepID=A0A9N7ZFM0_PLEPL|nr:unnamed protein product [Pleuronectes platessa]